MCSQEGGDEPGFKPLFLNPDQCPLALTGTSTQLFFPALPLSCQDLGLMSPDLGLTVGLSFPLPSVSDPWPLSVSLAARVLSRLS